MTHTTCDACGLPKLPGCAHYCAPPPPIAPPSVDTTAFLAELTELSRKHGLGIGGEPILFLMESGSSGDYERSYVLGDRSEVEFR